MALPVAMILLVVLSLGAVLASRRAAVLEEVTHSARATQVAHLAAQSGLRFCEAVVVDIVDSEGATHGALAPKLGQAVLDQTDHGQALWPALANWHANATHRIDVPVADQNASAALPRVPAPQCMAEPMTQGRFLITARGLSANTSFDDDGRLLSGAEVWLQSVIAPNVPIPSASGGFE
ncbi:MAG: hypothetical protein IBJ14_14855 [Hydrogenophaga sp.]|nr:hypothetical protein [Hydrogenophaga sp.]